MLDNFKSINPRSNETEIKRNIDPLMKFIYINLYYMINFYYMIIYVYIIYKLILYDKGIICFVC